MRLQHMCSRLVGSVIALVLASCSGKADVLTQLPPSGSNNHPSPFAGIPAPGALPVAPRDAAFNLALSLPAAETHARSQSWLADDAGSLSLSATQEWNWAIYRFSVVTELDDVLLLSLLGEGSGAPDQRIFVGLINADRSRWDWQALPSSQLPAALPFAPGPGNTGPDGDWLYVAVVLPPSAEVHRLDSARLDINTPVPPPQGLSASFGSNADGIQLEWTDFSYYSTVDPSLSADSVIIERSANGGASFTEIASVALSETSYLDENAPDGLERDRSYVYRIRYSSSGVRGNYSATARGLRGTPATAQVITVYLPEGDDLRVKLDAGGSSVDGTTTRLVGYDWDLDGDGAYEYQSSSPILSQLLNIPEAGLPYSLRLVDEYGLATEYESSIAFVDQDDFVITDDDGLPDPGDNGTLSGESGSYQLDFFYRIKFGIGPYITDIDFDWGGAFNDGTAGRVTLAAEVEAASGLNSAIDEYVPASMPDGEYYMAIRVTDSTAVIDGGPKSFIYVWPEKVVLSTFAVKDNDQLPDPGESGTLEGHTGDYTLDLYSYINHGGQAPYSVSYDFDYGQAWGDGVAGRTLENYSLKQVHGYIADLDVPVPASMPDGSEFRIAVRVVDSRADIDGGPRSFVYYWPVRLVLGGIIVKDNKSKPDPGFGSTMGGSPGAYTMDFYYSLSNGGESPFIIDFDLDYGSAWDDGPAGYVLNNYEITGYTGDLRNLNVPLPQDFGPGSYKIAVRVRDASTPVKSSIFVWPNPVVVGP